MKYKKLLSNCTSSGSDSSKAIVALLAGLAVGAVLGVLFAPSSGEETRGLIADKADALKEDLKDKYQAVKDRVASGKNDLVDLKDSVVDKVKSKAQGLSDEFKAYKEDSLNAVKDASDDANDAVQNA